jgi:ABC-type phosphate/phosphonate transport system substrate-binding protein
VLAGLCGATPAAAADPPAAGVQIGMVQGMFRDVQPALVQAMSRPLRDMIQKQTGLTGDVEIVADAHTLAERMKANRYQLGVYHGFEFAWVRKQHPNLVPLAVTVPPGRKLQALVVVHVDSKATSLADLTDESVVVPRGTKAHCILYLDRARADLPATTAVPKARPTVTPAEALDAVVTGESAAALVDVAALSGYQSLQPGAHKQLRVLVQSVIFPQTVIAYDKGSLSEATVGKIRRLLTEAHTTPAGKPLMMLWNLKGFEDVPADYDAQLDKIAQAYPPTPALRATGGMAPAGK